MISLSLENRNDDHKQDYCICTNFSRMQKQKVLKSVLGEDVSPELNKVMPLLNIKLLQCNGEKRTLIQKNSGSVSICGKSTQ